MANLKLTINSAPKGTRELLIPIEILQTSEQVSDGRIVSAIIPAWKAIYDQLHSDPDLLEKFSENPHAFEEFIAATYYKAGFKVTVTPRSGDLGRDVIAEKSGFVSLRIIDQCKAYSRGHVVSPNDVRSVMGVLSADQNASKAVLSTTSTFAPSVEKEWAQAIPHRLELRDGGSLMKILKELQDEDE